MTKRRAYRDGDLRISVFLGEDYADDIDPTSNWIDDECSVSFPGACEEGIDSDAGEIFQDYDDEMILIYFAKLSESEIDSSADQFDAEMSNDHFGLLRHYFANSSSRIHPPSARHPD
jgi:hypothetical protein